MGPICGDLVMVVGGRGGWFKVAFQVVIFLFGWLILELRARDGLEFRGGLVCLWLPFAGGGVCGWCG